MGRVRIGRVKLHGGADLKIYRNTAPDRCVDTFDYGITRIREARANDMAGYAVVAWSYQGAVTVDSLCGDARAVNPHNLAEFVASAITNQRTRYQAQCDIVGPEPDDGPDAA